MKTVAVVAGLAGSMIVPGELASGGQPRYTITDLGTLTDRTSVAYAVNADGVVTGVSAISGGSTVISKDPYVVVAEPWFFHAFLWAGSPMQDLGVVGRDVPPEVFPKPESQGWDINGSRQVIGRGFRPGENYHGLIWLPAPAYGMPAGMHEIAGFASSDPNTQLWGMNDAGQIVGESRPTGSIGPRPVLWQFAGGAWQITDLGDLGGPYGRAREINQLGQIVGQANVPSGQLRAFLRLETSAYGLAAGMHDIVPQFGNSDALDINEQGQIVGTIGTAPGQAFVWLPEPAYGLPAGGTMLNPSQVPDGAGAAAYALNNDGLIAGQVFVVVIHPIVGPVIQSRAMIWSNGMMRLLDELVADSGWRLISANDVNDAGQIVGWGFPPGETEKGHAFLVTPSLAPSADLDGDGVVGGLDLALLLGQWSGAAAYAPCPPFKPEDLNQDCRINGLDIAMLLGAWGPT